MRTKEQQLALAESILFLKGEDGIAVSELSETLELSSKETKSVLDNLETKLTYDTNAVYSLVKEGDFYKLILKKDNLNLVRDALAATNEEKLSKSVIETLTIIAYNQPIVKADVESVRGSSADYAIGVLKNLELIEKIGEDKTRKGHPSIYQTSPKFLEMFGLNSLEDLPEHEEGEIEEATKEMRNLFELEMTKEFEAFDLD